MKNTMKIISILFIVLMLVTVSVPAYAQQGKSGQPEKQSGGTTDITTGIMTQAKGANTTQVQALGGKIVGVVQAVGTVVAIVMLLVVGITYLTKSPEGKAEYKKSMGNYIIGALLIFGAATFVNMLYSVANGLK